MDIDQNKTLFNELSIQIKQQAHRSLSNLVDRADEIEIFLKSELVSYKENANLISPTVQNYLRDFIELVEHLTIWLELEIPSYSESDDFRIVVQNEILDEIASMKVNSIAYMGQFVDYREQRAIANIELFKRSKFDDNYYLITYLDDQFYRNLKLILMELKSYILRICNILTKNKELINRQSSDRQHVNNYF
jgi:hypothetical protein